MSVKDLEDLFKWNTSVDIKDKDGKVLLTLYLRLVGDVDYSQAQRYALLSSRKLRKELKNKDSIEYQSTFLDLNEKSKEDLIIGTLIAEVPNFRDAVLLEIGSDDIEDAVKGTKSLEEREEQQEAEEQAPLERVEKVRAKMEEKSEERRAELNKMSIDDLKKVFVDSTINFKCLEEFTNVFRDYCVFAGTYKDSKFKELAFSDFDSFRNISSTLKKQITDAYFKLEISGEQLKN